MIAVNPYEMEIIQAIIKKHTPNCDVLAFGSRYKWTHEDASDLDLVLVGKEKLDFGIIWGMKEDFMESDIPYKVDVSDYYGVSEAFRAIIDRGNERIYKGRVGLKSEWKLVRAADFIDFNPRESIPKGKMAKKVAMERLQPFCRDIPSYEIAPFNGGTKFRNGDTIMARITPCLENGKTAQVNILEGDEVGFGSTEFIVLREIQGISDKDYIYYLAISPILREKAIKSMVGSSGRQRVQQGVVNDIEFFAPPFSEQVEIGRILGVLDDKIANNTKINHCLEQIAQAVFKSWFVDFEPFGGEMPDDWQCCTINNISADIVCGKTPSTKVHDNFGDDIPFITIPDMHGKVYVTSTERSLSQKGANTQTGKTIPPNSICVSCIATAGLVSLTSVPSQTNQQINTIVCKDGISPYFVYLEMVRISEHIKMLGSSGSATNNLNKRQFSKIEVSIPKNNIMMEFAIAVEPLFETLKHNQQENAHLAALRDTLLPRLMAGEISIAEVV